MRRALAHNAPCALAAGAGSAVLAWLGLYGFAWNDYELEARPAFDALTAGHFSRFLALAPSYGGSLLERAPFALAPGLWHGGDLAVYRAVALPCLLAAALLALWLVATMRRQGRPLLARAVVLGLCVANPITLLALESGHPEELLGGALCVLAVLCAARQRALTAGLLLGLAIANKEWALLACGPVLLALEPRLRARCLALAIAAAAVVLAPLALAGSGGFLAGTRAVASNTSPIFQPWQLWWFLGRHGAAVHGLFGALKPGYRTGPSWIGEISHPLVIAIGTLPAAWLWLRTPDSAGAASRRGRALRLLRGPDQPLPPTLVALALALAMLVRCLLDSWDTSYYILPCLLALAAWEALGGNGERPPVIALGASVLAWISFQWLPEHGSADLQAAFFLLWTVPLAMLLAARLGARGVLAGPAPGKPREPLSRRP